MRFLFLFLLFTSFQALSSDLYTVGSSEYYPTCANGSTASREAHISRCDGSKSKWDDTLYNCRFSSGNLACNFTRVDGSTDFISRVTTYWSSSSCPSGQELNDSGECGAPETCEDKATQDAPWPSSPIPNDGKPMTASRYFCHNSCEARAGYSASNGSLLKEAFYTGNECVGNSDDYNECPYYGGCEGGDAPEPDPAPEGCEKPFEDVAYVCRQDLDGDGKPDPDAPFDEEAYCGHDSSGSFVCSGGSYDRVPDKECVKGSPFWPSCLNVLDPTDDISAPDGSFDSSPPKATVPIVTPENEEVEEVDPENITESTDRATLQAVQNLNADLNARTSELGITFKDAINELDKTMLGVKDNTKGIGETLVDLMNQNYDIYQQNKTLALQQTGEIRNGNYAITQGLDSINETLGNILNGNGRTFTEPSGDGSGNDGSPFTQDIESIKGEITELEQELKDVLSQSPVKLGQMNFNDATYQGESFTLSKSGWSVEVDFNLFNILGPHLNTIRNVIILTALLMAAFLILSSGRQK